MTDDVYQQIAETARKIYDQSTGDTGMVLQAIVHGAVAEIPGAQHAGITVIRNGSQVDTHAATGPHASTIDEIQMLVGEGPCLTAALDEHPTLFVDDIATDSRWRRYRRAVLERTPIRAIMSYQLFTGGHTLGALNVYAEYPRAFDSEAKEIGLVAATHAALVWDAARRDDQFRSALASRDIIGQAKGVLMERFDIDALEAFELLRRLSQDSNTRLKDVARLVIDNRRTQPSPTRLSSTLGPPPHPRQRWRADANPRAQSDAVEDGARRECDAV